MGRTTRERRQERQRAMLELARDQRIASQGEFARLLRERGFDVTQTTVSRDITELGLVKVPRGNGHGYASPAALADRRVSDATLRRVLGDLDVDVRRSGLILLLVSSPGSAGVIAEAIDRSTLRDQEGTLAGDNTVLVLFADEERLERWRARFEALRRAP